VTTMSIDKDLLAAGLADLWSPALLKIKQEKFAANPTLFSGLVGFAGIQMNLWPIWLQACDAADCPIPEKLQAIEMKDIQSSTTPWLCISLPYGGKVILVHIQAPGLMQNRKVLAELTLPAFMQMIRTLDDAGKLVVYAKASDILYHFGYTASNDAALTMPRITTEQLEAQWFIWSSAAELLREKINQTVRQAVEQSVTPKQLVCLFQEIAAALWQKLQENQLLTIEQQQSSFFGRLGFGKKSAQFKGSLILYGDHEVFWEKHQYHGNQSVKGVVDECPTTKH
ncbi:MAG TPA: hypothetical protein VFF80_05770, partial [Bacillota bacterium]|nr:hypothetical protein [Bacillota bacterium]